VPLAPQDPLEVQALQGRPVPLDLVEHQGIEGLMDSQVPRVLEVTMEA